MDEGKECIGCEWYDQEDDRCLAFECDGLNCDKPLPCEEKEESV